MARNGETSHFKPGPSGNSGGRHKTLKEIEKLASEVSPEAPETLIAIAWDDEPELMRVVAANAILNRAFGAAAGKGPKATNHGKRDKRDI